MVLLVLFLFLCLVLGGTCLYFLVVMMIFESKRAGTGLDLHQLHPVLVGNFRYFWYFLVLVLYLLVVVLYLLVLIGAFWT